MTCTVYLVERTRKYPSGKRAVYYTLRWSDTHGQMQEESLGKARKSGGKVTASEAEAARRKIESDINGGKALQNKPPALTLAAFFDELLESLDHDLRPATIVAYRDAADHAIAAIGADTKLSCIDYRSVGRIKNHLKDRSGATIRKTLIALRALFYRAVKHELIHKNPFAGVDMPEPAAKTARIFTLAEIDLLVKSAPDTWWSTFIRLAADTGLRKLELLHLRWSDLDFDAETVRVETHRAENFTVRGREFPIIPWSVKAKASTRTVPLSDAATLALQRWHVASDRSAYVFLDLKRIDQLRRHIGDRGLPVSVDPVPNVLPQYKAIQAEAGIAKPLGTLHDLRKTWCTRLAATLPLHVLKEFAGHTDIATTAKYYTRTTEADAAKLRRALIA